MKPQAETVEGPEAFTRFTAAMRRIVAVSKEVVQQREAEYKAKAALNPRKRGPKPKSKS